jgi:hypothetical protein
LARSYFRKTSDQLQDKKVATSFLVKWMSSDLGMKMFEHSNFRAHALECQRRAELANNDGEKRTWMNLAESWLVLFNMRESADHQLQLAKRDVASLIRELASLRN